MGNTSNRMSTSHAKPVKKSCFMFNTVVGEGGFGKVYSAMFLKNRQWMAIKEINKHNLLTHKTGLSMLMNELWSLQKLEHPFIISLHFAFHDKLSCYLVFDLKTGGDLRYYLRKKFMFEEKDVAFYVACISAALEYIHSKNILHRDIKPENIILDDRGYPHLADFGVAHIQQDFNTDVTITSRLASGTKQYLAPEVFTKSHVHGPESDYWSLGVVAFELLYGKRPFEKHAPKTFITYLQSALTLGEQRQKQMAAMTRGVLSAGAGGSGGPRPSSQSPQRPSKGSTSPSLASSSSPFSSSSSSSSSSFGKRPLPRGSGASWQRDSGETTREGVGAFDSQRSSFEESDGREEVKDERQQEEKEEEEEGEEGEVRGVAVPMLGSPRAGRHKRFLEAASANCTPCPSPTPTPTLTPTPTHAHAHRSSDPTPLQSTSHKAAAASRVVCPRQFRSQSLKDTKGQTKGHTKDKGKGCKGEEEGEDEGEGGPRVRTGAIKCPRDRDRDGGRGRGSQGGGGGGAHGMSNDADDEGEAEGCDDCANDEEQGDMDTPLPSSQHPEPEPAEPTHWVVEDELPPELQVNVPSFNVWLGNISPSCIALLEGLFDPRPSHRLGHGRRSLATHPWLREHGVGNRESVLSRRVVPHFVPGKRYSKEVMSGGSDGAGRIDSFLMDEGYDGGAGNGAAGCAERVSAEQERLFVDFYHVNEDYADFFGGKASVPANTPSSSSTISAGVEAMSTGTITTGAISTSFLPPQSPGPDGAANSSNLAQGLLRVRPGGGMGVGGPLGGVGGGEGGADPFACTPLRGESRGDSNATSSHPAPPPGSPTGATGTKGSGSGGMFDSMSYTAGLSFGRGGGGYLPPSFNKHRSSVAPAPATLPSSSSSILPIGGTSRNSASTAGSQSPSNAHSPLMSAKGSGPGAGYSVAQPHGGYYMFSGGGSGSGRLSFKEGGQGVAVARARTPAVSRGRQRAGGRGTSSSPSPGPRKPKEKLTAQSSASRFFPRLLC